MVLIFIYCMFSPFCALSTFFEPATRIHRRHGSLPRCRIKFCAFGKSYFAPIVKNIKKKFVYRLFFFFYYCVLCTVKPDLQRVAYSRVIYGWKFFFTLNPNAFIKCSLEINVLAYRYKYMASCRIVYTFYIIFSQNHTECSNGRISEFIKLYYNNSQ